MAVSVILAKVKVTVSRSGEPLLGTGQSLTCIIGHIQSTLVDWIWLSRLANSRSILVLVHSKFQVKVHT